VNWGAVWCGAVVLGCGGLGCGASASAGTGTGAVRSNKLGRGTSLVGATSEGLHGLLPSRGSSSSVWSCDRVSRVSSCNPSSDASPNDVLPFALFFRRRFRFVNDSWLLRNDPGVQSPICHH
jgi:hypothetical protein